MTRTPNLIPLPGDLSALNANDSLIPVAGYNSGWRAVNATTAVVADNQKHITCYALKVVPTSSGTVSLYLDDVEIVDIFNEHTIQFHSLVKSPTDRLTVQSTIFRDGADETTYLGESLLSFIDVYGVTKSDLFTSPESAGRKTDTVSLKVVISGHNQQPFYMTYPTLVNIYGWSANNFIQNARAKYIPHFYWDMDQQQDPEYSFYKLLDILTYSADQTLVKYREMFPYSLQELPVSADGLEDWANSNLVNPLHVSSDYLEWLSQFSGAALQKRLNASNIDINLFKYWQLATRNLGIKAGSTEALIATAALGLCGRVFSIDRSINGRIVAADRPIRTGISVSSVARNMWQFDYDGTFDHVVDDNQGTGFDDDIYVVKAQSDGKILCGGLFDAINGSTRERLARLNIDGTTDTSFDPPDILNKRTNLCANPSFETSTSGWTASQSPAVRSTALSYLGSASYLITMSSTTDSNVGAINIDIPVTGSFTMSLYVYTPPLSSLAGRTVSLARESGTAAVTSVSSTAATLVAGSWVRCSRTYTVTSAGTATMVARLSGTLSTAVGQSIAIDAVLAEMSTTAGGYFDGSTHPNASWSGTANLSTSQIAGRANLSTNPSFETNTTDWGTYNSSLVRTAGTIPGGAGSWSGVVTASTTAVGGVYQYFTPAPGSSISASVQCLRTRGSRTYRIGFEFYNSRTVTNAVGNGTTVTYTTSTHHGFSAGDPVLVSGITVITAYNGTFTINSVTSTTFTVTSSTTGVGTFSGDERAQKTLAAINGTAQTCAESTRLTVSSTVPALTTTAAVTIYANTTGSSTDSFRCDNLLIEYTSTLGDYFDGSTSDACSWTGTTNNSTSICSLGVKDIAILNDESIIVAHESPYAVSRFLNKLSSVGTVDSTFATNVGTNISGGSLRAIHVQDDGDILIAGSFAEPATSIGRFNSNGTEDTSFSTNAAGIFNGPINDVSVQSDGKIIVVGEFTKPTRYIARLLSTGAEDTEFSDTIGNTIAPVRLATTTGINLASFSSTIDGATLVNGDRVLVKDQELTATITAVAPGTPTSGKVRFTTSTAHGFSAGDYVIISGIAPGQYNQIYQIDAVASTTFDVVQVYADTVTKATGSASARREENGVYVYSGTSFTRSSDMNTAAEIQAEPIIAVTEGTTNAGTFWALTPYSANFTIDETFINAASSSYFIDDDVNTVAIDSDDKIVIGGPFTEPANHCARLLDDGSLDGRFNSNLATSFFGSSTTNEVTSIIIDDENNIYAAGEFYPEIKKLNSDGTENTAVSTQILKSLVDMRSIAVLPIYEDDPWQIHVMTLVRETADTNAASSITAVSPSTPSAGSVRYTTSAAHGFVAGDLVTIRSLSPGGYNGTFTITSAPTTTTFVVPNATTAGVTDATGTASRSSDTILELLEYSRPMGFSITHSSENIFEFTLNSTALGKLSKASLG